MIRTLMAAGSLLIAHPDFIWGIIQFRRQVSTRAFIALTSEQAQRMAA